MAGGSKNFIFLSKEIFNQITDLLNFNVIVTKENMGDITLELKELDLLAWGATLGETIESLIDDVIIYAEEYKDNIDLYSKAPNRKDHLIYIIKIWNSNKREDMGILVIIPLKKFKFYRYFY